MNIASRAVSSAAVVDEKFMAGNLLEVRSLKKAFSRLCHDAEWMEIQVTWRRGLSPSKGNYLGH